VPFRNEKTGRPHGVLVWGWGLLLGVAIWIWGFFHLPWWASVFLWWWPSAVAGGVVSLLGAGLASGSIPRTFARAYAALLAVRSRSPSDAPEAKEDAP